MIEGNFSEKMNKIKKKILETDFFSSKESFPKREKKRQKLLSTGKKPIFPCTGVHYEFLSV